MGSFANTVFSVLLGWVRSAVSYLWALLTGEGGGLIDWLGENWLTVVILLCAAGMAIDLIVYLLRWRPYQVWASFFRRLRGKGQEADEPLPIPTAAPQPRYQQPPELLTPVTEIPQEPRRAWVFADGSALPEEAQPLVESSSAEAPRYQPLPAVQELPPMMSAEAESRYSRPATPASAAPLQYAAAGRAYRRPPALHYEPEHQPRQMTSVPGLEDYPQPRSETTAVPQPDQVERVRPAEEKPPEPIRRQRLLKRMASLPRDFGLSNDDDELQLRYQPAPPAMDKREAYHEPVYPPQWQPPADRPSTKEESSR